jgi:hypothetical protein
MIKLPVTNGHIVIDADDARRIVALANPMHPVFHGTQPQPAADQGDDAAETALLKVHYDLDVFGCNGRLAVPGYAAARAILAAIKRGDIPLPFMATQADMAKAYQRGLNDAEALGANPEELRQVREDCAKWKARAEKAEAEAAECNDLCNAIDGDTPAECEDIWYGTVDENKRLTAELTRLRKLIVNERIAAMTAEVGK